MPDSIRVPQRILAFLIVACITIGSVGLILVAIEKSRMYFARAEAFEILRNLPSKFRVVGKSTIVKGFDGISIHLNETNITDEDLFYIGKLEEIVILDLSRTHVGPEGLRQCTSLVGLRQLYLADTSIGDTVWSVVDHFPKLTILDIANTNVTGERIPDSLRLPYLKSFNGDGAEINDSGLAKICKACPHLESLSFSETNVTSNASISLNHLRRLGALSISGTRIDDHFIVGLSVDLLKNLVVLRAQNTAISDNTIRLLHADYPQLRVDLGEGRQVQPR